MEMLEVETVQFWISCDSAVKPMIDMEDSEDQMVTSDLGGRIVLEYWLEHLTRLNGKVLFIFLFFQHSLSFAF